MGTERFLAFGAIDKGASLLAAEKSPTSSLADGSALASFSSATWTAVSCQEIYRKQRASGVSFLSRQG